MDLSDHEVEILRPMEPPERARHLLEGRLGPLEAIGGFPAHVAALAYLVSRLRSAARNPSRGGMLAGRPGYEADDTLRNRVLAAAECSGSLREFAVVLADRLGLQLASLHARDLMWWHGALAVHAERWPELSDDLTLTDVLMAARLLDDLTWTIRKELEKTDDDA